MVQPFAFKPLNKVERAYQHIGEVQKRISAFLATDIHELISEFDAKSGRHFLKFRIKQQLPSEINMAFGDAIHNLRAALDHTIAAFVDPKDIITVDFPFHEERHNLVDRIDKGKIKSASPAVADFILNDIQPYKAGNYPLWALNKLDNIDKHRLLIAIVGLGAFKNINAVTAGGRISNMFMVRDLTVDDTVLATSDAPFELKNDPEPVFDILIGEKDFFPNKPVLPTLHYLASIVNQTIRKLAWCYEEERERTGLPLNRW